MTKSTFIRPISFLLCLTFLTVSAESDAQYRRKKKQLFEYDGNYRPHGWHFAPGLSFTFTEPLQNDPVVYDLATDTSLFITKDQNGKLGMYAEFGYFHLIRYGIVFQYLDYSVAFKQLRGAESYTGEVRGTSTDELYSNVAGSGVYKETFATFNFNLNNVIQVTDYNFITNSLGLDFNYRFSDKTEFDPATSIVPLTIQPQMRGGLHYKLGFGNKVYDNFFWEIMAETPILNVYPWNGATTSLHWFNSKYRPVIFTFRFMFQRGLRKEDCPPVWNSPFDPVQ